MHDTYVLKEFDVIFYVVLYSERLVLNIGVVDVKTLLLVRLQWQQRNPHLWWVTRKRMIAHWFP